MDGLDVIMKAEKQAAKLKLDAAEEANAILRAAENYRDVKLEKAQAEGGEQARRLLREAEDKARADTEKLKVQAEIRTDEICKNAVTKLDSVAVFIAERITEG